MKPVKFYHPVFGADFKMNPVALAGFICITVLGIIDLGFVVFGGVGASLSSFIVGHSVSSIPDLSIFIFMMGCMAGHLFFGMSPVGLTDEQTEELIKSHLEAHKKIWKPGEGEGGK